MLLLCCSRQWLRRAECSPGRYLQDKAKHYAHWAASVGSGGISSDDPAALVKLRAELSSLERAQDLMKAVNKAIRTDKTQETQVAASVAIRFEGGNATQLVSKNVAGRIGLPVCRLANINSNMARIKLRIADLEKRRQREDAVQVCEGFMGEL